MFPTADEAAQKWLREQDLGGTGHPPDHGKKHQKIYVDKIALFFLCLQDKKSGYESQGVVKKKVLFKINKLNFLSFDFRHPRQGSESEAW